MADPSSPDPRVVPSPPAGTIAVVLADDHPIVRQGLAALLAGAGDCAVVGEASDGLAALALIARLRPAVAVLDISMPGLDGLEVARRARAASPATALVVLSMHADEAYVLAALHRGAVGYVLKADATEHLVAAVRAAAAGGRYLSPPLLERAIAAYARRAQEEARPLDRYELLTGREREVLQLTVEGLGDAAIGARLSISPRTAESHRANLLRKLGLRTPTDLVRYAARRGLLPG